MRIEELIRPITDHGNVFLSKGVYYFGTIVGIGGGTA